LGDIFQVTVRASLSVPLFAALIDHLQIDGRSLDRGVSHLLFDIQQICLEATGVFIFAGGPWPLPTGELRFLAGVATKNIGARQTMLKG
jgi:hypothetical protein